MSDWIEINLPFAELDASGYPEFPDTSEEERRLFGATCEEALDKVNFDLVCDINGEVEDEINAQQGVASEEQTLSEREARHDLRYKMVQERLFRDYPEVAQADLQRTLIESWRDSHPLWEAWRIERDRLAEEGFLRTFVGQGLNRPGVQIELDDGKRYLIGDINLNSGVCDDCTPFEGDAVIKRYRVLLTPEDLE